MRVIGHTCVPAGCTAIGKTHTCSKPTATHNQAEKQRLLQAEEVAVARVREMETKVDGLRRELEEVAEKEKEASALKAASIGENWLHGRVFL